MSKNIAQSLRSHVRHINGTDVAEPLKNVTLAPFPCFFEDDFERIRRIILPFDFEAEIRVFCIDPEDLDISREIYLLIISEKITSDVWFMIDYYLRKEFKGRYIKTYVVKEINSGLLRIAYDCSVRI
ncbi:MAG: hypothetical protein ACK4EX_09025 [Thermaurantimonas sp.]|uniref:hypothetical protein n=1 Tax=Thermaurantimonas sp. TaxID=2681568 RepID=UPI00391DE7C5